MRDEDLNSVLVLVAQGLLAIEQFLEPLTLLGTAFFMGLEFGK